jgi:MFS family permease
MDAESRPSLGAWGGVAILWFFYVIAFMDRGVIALMVQPIMDDLHITKIQMGVLQGFAFATTYSLGALPMGWAVDRLNRRRILFAGVFVWSCGTIACGLCRSYEHMAAARALVGLGEAALTPTALSLIADMFPRNRIGTATAVFSSGATMGVGAALIFGGTLLHGLEAHGVTIGHAAPWQTVFLVFGSCGACASLLSFLIPDDRSRRANSGAVRAAPAASLVDFGRFMLARAPLLLCLFLAFPLLLTISNAYLAWVPHHFETSFGWDAHRTGLVLGFLNLLAPVLGVITGGYAMDQAMRAGVRAPHIVVPLISTLVGVPLLAAGLLVSVPSTAITLLAVGLFVFNAFAAAQGTLIQLLAPPDMRGRFAAVYMLVVSLVGTGLGAVLPPLINSAGAGAHHGVGWATAVAILGIGAIVSIVLFLGRSQLHAALTESTPKN